MPITIDGLVPSCSRTPRVTSICQSSISRERSQRAGAGICCLGRVNLWLQPAQRVAAAARGDLAWMQHDNSARDTERLLRQITITL